MKQTKIAARAPYSFNVVQHDDRHIFTYKRSRYGLHVLIGMCFIVGIPLWIGFYWLLKPPGTMEVGLKPLYLALVCVLCLFVLINIRTSGSFSISKTHISVNGVAYDLSHVLKFYVREPNTPDDPAHAMAGALYALIEQMSKSNHSVCFAYGEARVKLAGGLSLVAAETMLAKINETLNPHSKPHFYL